MNSAGQTICLNMIVKNEKAVIRRCLDSVRPIVDHWVIVDTGSTDGTQDLIREHFGGIPGELIERGWVNFAHNRSEALRHARGKCDYVFVIDADEVLEFDSDFVLPELSADAYHFEMLSGGVTYFKTQLVRDSLDWCFKNVVHEYIYSERARTEDVLRGVRTLRFPDGARARDPLTYRKDALMLESALLKEPDNSRYMFYLAQSYRDANEPQLAIDRYQKRVAMGGWIEEVWYSLYQIAEIKNRMQSSWPEVLDAYLQAFHAKPDRAGPLYKIGFRYQARREFSLSHLFFREAMAIPYPKNDRLFVEKNVYDYLLPLEYAVSCFYAGDHASAIDTNNRLLTSPDTPASLIDQIIRNRQYSLDALYPKRREATGRPNPIKVCVSFADPGPQLDNCVESLLLQDYKNFEVTFFDNGSARDYSSKIPLEDGRFRLIRHADRKHWGDCISRFLAEHCNDGDIVFPIDGVNWLADAGTLAYVNRFFDEYDCSLMYGQYRYSSGQLGLAMPFTSAAELDAPARPKASVSPVVFRASLARRGPALNGDGSVSLIRRAGFAHARFNDQPILVWNLDQ